MTLYRTIVADPPWAYGSSQPGFTIASENPTPGRAYRRTPGKNRSEAAEHWAEAMGIDWMTRSELAEAIPPAYPAYTEYIGVALLDQLARSAAE